MKSIVELFELKQDLYYMTYNFMFFWYKVNNILYKHSSRKENTIDCLQLEERIFFN